MCFPDGGNQGPVGADSGVGHRTRVLLEMTGGSVTPPSSADLNINSFFKYCNSNVWPGVSPNSREPPARQLQHEPSCLHICSQYPSQVYLATPRDMAAENTVPAPIESLPGSGAEISRQPLLPDQKGSQMQGLGTPPQECGLYHD